MMKRYEEYRPTGLNWFPEIPNGWEWRFLSQVAHEQNIKKPAGEMYPVMTLSYGEIKRKANIDAGLVPSNYDNYQILYKGNIVLRLIDLQNDHTSLRTGLVNETGIITSAYTCIVPTENAAYIRYVLHSYDTKKVFYGYGGGVRQSIGYKDIRHLQVPVPPRAEQDQIVCYLDWQVSKINRLIAAKRKEIAHLRELVQQIATNTVYHGIDPMAIYKPVKMLFVDKIPTSWECRRGKYLLAEHDIRSVDGKEELLSVSHITGVTPRNQKNITMFKSESLVNYKICRKGDIAANTMWMWQGAIAVSSYHGVISPSYNTYHQINNVFDTTYLDVMLRTKPLVDEYYVRSIGIRKSRLRLYPEQLLGMFFPVPPLLEQRMIAERIIERTQIVNDMICTVEQQIEMLQEMRTRLISDVVTGQVDVRGIEVPDGEYINTETFEEEFEEETEEE